MLNPQNENLHLVRLTNSDMMCSWCDCRADYRVLGPVVKSGNPYTGSDERHIDYACEAHGIEHFPVEAGECEQILDHEAHGDDSESPVLGPQFAPDVPESLQHPFAVAGEWLDQVNAMMDLTIGVRM